MSRRNRVLIYCMAAGLLCLPAAWPTDDTFIVRMTGYADGIGRTARETAIQNALHEIVQSVLENLAGPGQEAVLQPMLRQSAKYIQHYDVLRDDQEADSTRVEIDAHILEKALRQDLAALMLPRLPAPPEVRLLIGEKLGLDQIIAVIEHGTAETTLREGLEQWGLKTSGIDALGDRYTPVQLMEIVQDAPGTGEAFAQRNSADVVVIGTALTEDDGQGSAAGALRRRANLTLRTHRGVDGKLMDVLTATAVVESEDPMEGSEQAVQDACAKLLGEIAVSAVITVLGSRVNDEVIVTVERPGNRKRFDEILLDAQTIPGVESITELFYFDEIARFRLHYNDSMAHLVDFLTEYAYDGLKPEVTRAVERKVVLSFP